MSAPPKPPPRALASRTTAPRTLAIVLHFRREAMTAACVESLERSVAPVDVLIVDNASGDGSAERLRARFPQHAHLATGKNLWYAGGNNAGIVWALERGYERLLIINDDAAVTPDMLGQLHAALDADPGAAMAAPSILHEQPSVVWWAGGRFSWLRCSGLHEGAGKPLPVEAAASPPRAVSFVSGCCFVVTAAALRKLGAFREDFESYVEDVELSLRYRRAGQRLLYVPAAMAVHKVPYPEPEPAAWKLTKRDRNRRRVVRAHYGIGQRVLFFPVFWLTRALRVAQYLLRGDLARARAIVAGTFGPA